MTMKKILEMRRENARLKAMEILNKAEKEDRVLSSEEQKEFDKYEDEIRSWDASIKRAERMTSLEPYAKIYCELMK